MQNFGSVSLGKITNVRTINGNTDCYFCQIELQERDAEVEVVKYVATKGDVAVTGKWVYMQITKGRFEGEIVDLPEGIDPFTLEAIPDQTVIDARFERDKRLSITDWTQMPDIPQAIRDLWQPYRQALRDVPQQAGFPDNIVWPTPPTP